MDSSGYGFVGELNGVAINQLVVKTWDSIKGKIPQIKKPIEGLVPIKYGLEFYYHAVVAFVSLPPSEAGGLSDQSVHSATFADAGGKISILLSIAVNLDVRLELRFPGDAGRAREAGEFIHTEVETIWLAELDVVPTGIGTANEQLELDVGNIRVHDPRFLGVGPQPKVEAFVNSLSRALLPGFVKLGRWPVSFAYGDLRKIDMTAASFAVEGRTLQPDATGKLIDVTGRLKNDDRFAAGLLTYIAVGLKFQFAGEGDHLAGPLPFLLPSHTAQSVRLTVTNYALRYIERYVIPKVVNEAVHAKLGKDSPRGLMAIDVEHGGQITDSDDDGVLVLTRIYGLNWSNGRLRIAVDAYDIQRGLFGLDDLAPDISVHVYTEYSVVPNDSPGSDGNIDYSKPKIGNIKVNFVKDDSAWEFLTAPFVFAEKFVNSIGAALEGHWRDALINLVEGVAQFPLVVTTVGWVVLLFFGGVSVSDKDVIPSLRFKLDEDVVLEVTTELEALGDGACDRDFEGFTFFARIR